MKGERTMNGSVSAMTEFLGTMSEIATWIFGQVTTVGQTIMDTPYLLVTTGFLLVGGAIGIFGRLLSKN